MMAEQNKADVKKITKKQAVMTSLLRLKKYNNRNFVQRCFQRCWLAVFLSLQQALKKT